MKRSRFTEEQSIGILKEAEAGATGKEVCRCDVTRSSIIKTGRVTINRDQRNGVLLRVDAGNVC